MPLLSLVTSGHDTAPGIARLPKRTFRQHIAERLRAAILAGELAPGSQVIESTLARQFDVSRGPLREAMRELIEEGLLVTVPYTGTHVVSLSELDIRETYSVRAVLERFAFQLLWPRRDAQFEREMTRRHALLTSAVDAGNDLASIQAELDLHALAYEFSGHRLLLRTWQGLRGRQQLCWAAHHRAHGTRGPRRDAHDSYVQAALGPDLQAMLNEIDQHIGQMSQAALRTQDFAQAADSNDSTASSTTPGVLT